MTRAGHQAPETEAAQDVADAALGQHDAEPGLDGAG